jgi:hypothetical protein
MRKQKRKPRSKKRAKKAPPAASSVRPDHKERFEELLNDAVFGPKTK